MTVYELKEILDCLRDDDEIYIGMYQNYGCNFIYDIRKFEESRTIHNFWGESTGKVHLLIEGEQFATMYDSEDEEEEEEYDDEEEDEDDE